jgi:hypothetical protein
VTQGLRTPLEITWRPPEDGGRKRRNNVERASVPGKIATIRNSYVKGKVFGAGTAGSWQRDLNHDVATLARLNLSEDAMSRWLLFLVAVAAVVTAQFVDRGSKELAEGRQWARGTADDAIQTGTVRRQPQR